MTSVYLLTQCVYMMHLLCVFLGTGDTTLDKTGKACFFILLVRVWKGTGHLQVFGLPSLNPLQVPRNLPQRASGREAGPVSHYTSHRPDPRRPALRQPRHSGSPSWAWLRRCTRKKLDSGTLTLKQLTQRSRDSGDFIWLGAAASSAE